MNVIRTKTSIAVPGARTARRLYLEWLHRHAEADAKAHERQAEEARKEAQRLRVEIAQLTD